MSFFQMNQSNDEYVEQKKVQFKVEGLYIVLGMLIVNILQGFIRGKISDHVLLSLGIVFFFVMYYMLRKALTGVEHPNIASEKRYNKKRKEIIISSLIAFGTFLGGNIIHKLVFSPHREWIDIFAVSALFLVIWFLIDYFSVKRSYQKNQEIDDE